jgi:hypothetical protein
MRFVRMKCGTAETNQYCPDTYLAARGPIHRLDRFVNYLDTYLAPGPPSRDAT